MAMEIERMSSCSLRAQQNEKTTTVLLGMMTVIVDKDNCAYLCVPE